MGDSQQNIFSTILGMRFVVRLIFLLISLRVANSWICGLDGMCQGAVSSSTYTFSFDNCVLFSRSLENVTWISFNFDSGMCLNLQDCPAIDAEVPSTVSSEVGCPICDAVGECMGKFLNVHSTDDSEGCLEECRAQAGCQWYKYNKDSSKCLLLKSCFIIDSSEPQWVSGEVSCAQAGSTTTAATTTSAPSLALQIRSPKLVIM